MVSLALPGGFTEPFFKGVAIPLMDRRRVCFLRRKSLIAQCILHLVVEQHIRIEPGRVNREDYATYANVNSRLFLLLLRVSWTPKCAHIFYLQPLVDDDRSCSAEV